MTPISVLLLTNLPGNRARVAQLLSGLPELDLVGVAADVSAAFVLAETSEPKLVIVGEEFRGRSEFNAMRAFFDALNARWIFLGAEGPGSKMVALSTGQMVLEPVLDLNLAPAVLLGRMRQALSIMRRPSGPSPDQRPVGARPVFDKIVVIGASTGGVDALLTLLSEFPEDCPPTAIVQHTGRGFSDSLIRLLERRCRPHIVAAQDGLTLKQGMVCVAAGSLGHLTVTPGTTLRCNLREGPPISGHVPSVDALFRSVVPLAPQVVGVILTGMGQDGAAGLLDLRRGGGVTLGQDEATSVVYGMPRAAWEIGAVQMRLPLQRIGPELLKAALAPASQQMGHMNAMVTR